jgi:hypothetical protein
MSLDGHRSDDLKPYVYVTRDYGRTWTSITSDLPAFGNVNTVRQDRRNKNLLYAGTEFGFFASLDEGRSWKKLMTGLPVVRIDDVITHPRDNDLVLSTHGRSIWILDDITPLQQMAMVAPTADVVLFEPRSAVRWKEDIRMRRNVTGAKNYRGQSAPEGTAISYYLKSAPSGDVKITIRALGSNEVWRAIDGTATAGMNRVQWNLCSDPRPPQPGQAFGGGGGGGGVCQPQAAVVNPVDPEAGGGQGQGGGQRVGRQAPPGAYVVTLTVNGRDYTRSVTVLDDVWMQ